MGSRIRILGFIAAILCGVGVTSAQAQLQEVLELNRHGMEAYVNLELEEATDRLQRALQAARTNGITGAPLARTYLNLGILAIGGFGDNGQGMDYFVQAIETDPSIRLDPLLSTPEIQSVFRLARRRARVNRNPDQGSSGQQSNTGDTLEHEPPPEQLVNTAVPLFVRTEDSVDSVYTYYKAPGMRDFRRFPMERMDGGFGIELPCLEIMEPQIEYYIVAFDGERVVGSVGSAESPRSIAIVQTRSFAPAALPGMSPPEQCIENECPPGMPGCESRDGVGDTCVTSSDCSPGLSCEDNFCVSEDEDDDDDDDDAPVFFLRAGFAAGFGYAASGRPADSVPADIDGNGFPDLADPQNAAYEPKETNPDCAAQANSYCVRLERPGLLPALALRFTVGGWVHARIGFAGIVRYQFDHGKGGFASTLLGLRAMVRLLPPAATGFQADVHIGTTYGQIQLRPPQNGVIEPYITSGLNGVQIGGTVGYHIVRNFHVYVTPEIHLLFPTFLFAFDIDVGIGASF